MQPDQTAPTRLAEQSRDRRQDRFSGLGVRVFSWPVVRFGHACVRARGWPVGNTAFRAVRRGFVKRFDELKTSHAFAKVRCHPSARWA